MRTRLLAGAALIILSLTGFKVSAHIGSPDILYEGNAGPYKVLVSVRPPDVVPGVAEIHVRVVEGQASRVTVQPIYFRSGSEGAPRPDDAAPVPGDPSFFSGNLWLMEFGSSSVNVAVDGHEGAGSVLVPVPAIATARRGINTGLGLILAGMGLLLFASAVAGIGAAVRESVLAPGEEVSPVHKNRARKIMLVTAVLFASALVLGNSWWTSVDGRYLRHMFKPIRLSATTTAEQQGRVLRLVMDDPGWLNRKLDDLVPDHGKLMHMFLVREPALDAFAHLHPLRKDSRTFETIIPPVPAGRYRIYADIVHENGLTETLVTATDVPATPDMSAPPALTDPDDSWLGPGASLEATSRLADGSIMTWERETDAPLKAGSLHSLRFSVKAPDGTPANLEAYLGMQGHAALMRDDGSVFIHLHPVGTISMAAQQAFVERVGTINPDAALTGAGGMDHSKHATRHSTHNSAAPERAQRAPTGATADNASRISFPYSFPSPGRYLIWVQVKREGRVLTGLFEANVQ